MSVSFFFCGFLLRLREKQKFNIYLKENRGKSWSSLSRLEEKAESHFGKKLCFLSAFCKHERLEIGSKV